MNELLKRALLAASLGARSSSAALADAGRGLFDDHDLQAPAGVTLRQRRAWFD